MTIGQRIALKRKAQALSQEALGETLGVSRQSIYKWESDSALPEIDKLIALSRLFSVSVGWLLGVEEPPAEEASLPEESRELTETQLHLVEEIVDRYLAAQPAPRKRRRWPWALAGVALFFVVFNLFESFDMLRMQNESLQNNISRVERSVDSQINGISNRVEELLKTQNNLTADYEAALISRDLAQNTAAFSLRAVPKTYTEGMTALFLADCGAGAVEFPAELGPGRAFSAEIGVDLTDSITLSVVFIAPDGTRQTQLLENYDDLYSETLPELNVNDDLMWLDLGEERVLTLPAQSRYVWVRQYETMISDAPVSTAADIRVGLFKNQALAAWGKPCEKPSNFQGFEDAGFFLLPAVEIPIAAGDTLHVAAVVTDEYGRTIVQSGVPYILDEEAGKLTHPSYSQLDSDPAHWKF